MVKTINLPNQTQRLSKLNTSDLSLVCYSSGQTQLKLVFSIKWYSYIRPALFIVYQIYRKGINLFMGHPVYELDKIEQ